MAAGAAILAIKVLGDAKGGQKALRDTETSAGGLQSKLSALGGAAKVGLLAVGAAAIGAGKALYDIGSTFDEVTDTIRVGTGATGDALDGLVNDAKKVATSVPTSFEAAASTVADVNTRMGLTGETMQKVASQYLEAGRILGEDIDIGKSSAAFAAFGIKGDQVSGALDHLFRVSQATGVGMNDLSGIIQQNAGALSQLGFSFEDSAALAGVLDKAGIDANATLKSMQKGLISLAKNGEAPAEAFQRVTGEIDGLIKSGKETEALNIASKVFGTKGAVQFTQAVKSGSLSLKDITAAAGVTSDTILGVGKETQDAAEKWEILKNRGLAALEPLAAFVFDGLGKALDAVLGWLDTVDLSVLTNAGTALQTVWAKVAPALQTAIGQIQPVLNAAGTAISAFTSGVTTLWTTHGQTIINVFSWAWTTLTSILTPVLTIIQGLITTVTGILTGNWSKTWTGIKQVFSGVWNAIGAILRGAVSGIKGILSGALNLIRSLWSGAWNGINGILAGAWNAISSTVSSGIGRVVSWFTGLPGRIAGALSGIGGRMAGIGRNMISSLANALSPNAIINKISSVIGDAIGYAKRLLGIASPSKVFTRIGQQTGDGLVVGIGNRVTAIRRASSDMIASVIPDKAPTIPIDLAARITSNGLSGPSQTSAPTINITINGALDPAAVARQVRSLINHDARVRGVVPLAGAVIA